MKAIEVTGSVNEAGYVAFDQPIANAKPLRFRGILLLPDAIDSQDEEWSPDAISASVRDLLDDPEEDIYTLEDGEPIDDVDPTIQSAWVAEAQRRHDEISDGRVQPIDGDQALMETLYLLSIPGMRESIREGMATPIEDCDRDMTESV